MRGVTGFVVLAVSVLACRETVVIDQSAVDAGGGFDGGLFCSGLPTEFRVQSPEVMVALDRSSTMNSRFGDSTLLATARDALDVSAARYQKVVSFGYVEFPGASGICNNGQVGCCASAPSAPNPNYAKFGLALHACDQNALPSCATASYQRPTVPALTGCEVVFSSRFDETSRYILLITNGAPDCGSGQNSGCSDAQTIITDMARNYFVNTVVVAPGPLDPMASDCLEGMAINGGARNAPYFRPASNQTDLAMTIDATMRGFAMDACNLDLMTRIADPDRVGVTWKDAQLQRGGNGGWEVGGNGFTITLHGQSCDQLIEDGPADFAVFPDCNPVRR